MSGYFSIQTFRKRVSSRFIITELFSKLLWFNKFILSKLNVKNFEMACCGWSCCSLYDIVGTKVVKNIVYFPQYNVL